VRDRLYRGFACAEFDFAQAFLVFNAKRDAIYELFRNQEGLDPGRLDRAPANFDEFSEIINHPRKVEREIMNRCRRR
jgi:hypothetical protein